MQLHELKLLLKKVEVGKATSQEIAALEQYADLLAKNGDTAVFKSELEKRVIHDELRKRITLPAESVQRSWYKIAASVAILISLATTLWFGYDYWDNNAYIVESTLPGESKLIELPDGSVVSLNGASTLAYKPMGDASERQVRLVGEAFFKVAKDPNRPFTVESQDVFTTVLGTEFNINAFQEDSSVVVSLTEGLVMVEAFGNSKRIWPMQQAIFEATEGSLTISAFDSTDAAIAWLSGDVVLNKMSLDQFTRFVQRRYGVVVQLEAESISDYTISGRFKKPSAELLIASVASAKNLDFTKNSETEYILKSKSK